MMRLEGRPIMSDACEVSCQKSSFAIYYIIQADDDDAPEANTLGLLLASARKQRNYLSSSKLSKLALIIKTLNCAPTLTRSLWLLIKMCRMMIFLLLFLSPGSRRGRCWCFSRQTRFRRVPPGRSAEGLPLNTFRVTSPRRSWRSSINQQSMLLIIVIIIII